MDGQTDGRTDGQTDGQMDRLTNVLMDGEMDPWTDIRTDREMDVRHKSSTKHLITLPATSGLASTVTLTILKYLWQILSL
jgi:hypothetical protein